MNIFILIIGIIITDLFLSPCQTTTVDTIEEEQFIYDIVIPYPKFRSLETFLSYRIYGFNQTFNLFLIKNETFLLPSFFTQYFNENQTWINREIKHCFYQGYVNDNRLSIVFISLCNGLFGTFVYHNVEYVIQPKYYENGTSWNFEHLFYTRKDLSLSKEPTIRCSVNDNPSFEESRYSHHHQSSDLTQRFLHRNKRQFDFDSMTKHVEILVAYDDSIKEFHSDIDIRSYILTLFSYVSHLYSDASIGNNIKISLVKLIELGKDLSNSIKSVDDAADTLRKFCQWQKDYNIPVTYDAAVLLTRIRLCNKRSKNLTSSKCDTLGITELGTMCNLTSNCAVVRDNGFATAFTIAHEIAHLFGVRHDNDNVCLHYNKEQNIMATSLTFNHNHYTWSNCSRHYFTQFLESNRYPCLNNAPDYKSVLFGSLNDEQKAGELPGYFSDLDEQCRRAFGIGFEYCKDLSHGVSKLNIGNIVRRYHLTTSSVEPKCVRLYCREILSYSSLCITNHAHWSDGTLCSESRMEIKRCFRGQCRNIQDFQAINGNWGEWLPWSPCTRTCGSAVQKSRRFCDNPRPENGGRYCSGQSTRIRSCEDNPSCEDTVDTFRQRQCSIYDNRTIGSSLPIGVRFEPKYNVLPNLRCKLICKVIDDHLERSFILSDRVEDGTPCGREDETRDICINGICMSIGCDLKYGSNAIEDICGVCNGQNRTCKLINGHKFISDFGITHITIIPSNTTRVSIIKTSAENDRYYLAVKYINGTYLLNGLQNLQLYSIKIRLDHAILVYSGSDSINESILITGRLQIPLEIQMISMDQLGSLSTEVYWEYYLPFDEDKSLADYCNRPCQGFRQVKKCIIHEKEYDLNYCLIFKISFEYEQERCNDHCVLSWTIKYQQTCSTRCGDGHKRVLYRCTKISSEIEAIDDSICRKYIDKKPKNIVSCVGDCKGTGWVYGNWSECHEDGHCVRKRSAECRNSLDLRIATNYCISEFMFDTERCLETACKQSRWNFTVWSDCDCMSNYRRRNVSCVRNGKTVNDHNCLYEPKPDEIISCLNECFTPHWKTDHWQPCTATCLSYEGIRHRRVVCSYGDLIVQDDYCNQQLKPIEQEWCTTNNSCLTWSTDEWSSCSVTCGLGFQQRRVYCNELTPSPFRVPDSKCWNLFGENSKPNEQQNCSITECPYWQINSSSNCSGKCELVTHYRHIWCLSNGLKIDDHHCLPISKEVGILSECLVTCGNGIQYRLVSCKNKDEIISLEECGCDDSINKMNLSISECMHSQVQPLDNRICPILHCLEWRVAHWHGCSIKCGVGIEDDSDFDCYTRQIPIRRLNARECELVKPRLVKPILRRECRRSCVERRTNGSNKFISNNNSSKKSFSLLFLFLIILQQLSDFLS